MENFIKQNNEFDKTYDDGAGKVMFEVDLQGNVTFANSYEKDIQGFAKVSSQTSVKANILDIAAKIAAKTAATWDDQAIIALRSILGLTKESVPNAPASLDEQV